MSSGAYVPTDVGPGEIQLMANEAYWAGQPAIARVTVLTDIGGRSPVDVYEDRSVDWIPISDADAAWIRFDSELGPDLRRSDEMTVDFLGFDTTRPPFDDARVRRAVGHGCRLASDRRARGVVAGRAGHLPAASGHRGP